MKSIVHYCQGESHKASAKPCQDCAWAESTPELSIAIVSDGHGGARFFRSHIGSQVAVDVTVKAVKEFLKELGNSSYAREKRGPLFVGEKFTDCFAENVTSEQAHKAEHKALMWLFSSIINEWNKLINLDATSRDLSEWELANVEQAYISDFNTNRQFPEATCEKTYGCTLMAYVQTRDFWFAFHIGDGKFVAFDNDNGTLACSQPIPWDERCFLNKTTSLCDSSAIDRFRYCYQGDGHFPLAVFLGSDGLDDTYGDGEHLHNFYIQLYKLLITKGYDKVMKTLVRDLPRISMVGSRDDMSVAAIYDDSEPVDTFLMLSNYQEDQLIEKARSLDQKIAELQQKIEGYGDPENLSKADQINLQYAKSNLQRALNESKRNKAVLTAIRSERTKFKNKNSVRNEPPQLVPPLELPLEFDSDNDMESEG